MSGYWPRIRVGSQELIFICNYGTLLQLETVTDGKWQDELHKAIAATSPRAVIDMTALMTGMAEAHIIELSPPMSAVSKAISDAWTICMAGPEALRHLDKAADGEAAADGGKTLSTLSDPVSEQPLPQASTSETSGI